MKDELKIIINISKEAGKILMKYYKKEHTKEIKNDDKYDFVTNVDREADIYIVEKINTLPFI
ncbi:hypothetical protein HYU23_00420 [Candidatus Woesearchaeota archaeon]|nr:hypothetical protein [Candidatus Woesearchaeota archaeon]